MQLNMLTLWFLNLMLPPPPYPIPHWGELLYLCLLWHSAAVTASPRRPRFLAETCKWLSIYNKICTTLDCTFCQSFEQKGWTEMFSRFKINWLSAALEPGIYGSICCVICLMASWALCTGCWHYGHDPLIHCRHLYSQMALKAKPTLGTLDLKEMTKKVRTRLLKP